MVFAACEDEETLDTSVRPLLGVRLAHCAPPDEPLRTCSMCASWKEGSQQQHARRGIVCSPCATNLSPPLPPKRASVDARRHLKP